MYACGSSSGEGPRSASILDALAGEEALRADRGQLGALSKLVQELGAGAAGDVGDGQLEARRAAGRGGDRISALDLAGGEREHEVDPLTGEEVERGAVDALEDQLAHGGGEAARGGEAGVEGARGEHAAPGEAE